MRIDNNMAGYRSSAIQPKKKSSSSLSAGKVNNGTGTSTFTREKHSTYEDTPDGHSSYSQTRRSIYQHSKLEKAVLQFTLDDNL
jgi:hypothetical protein